MIKFYFLVLGFLITNFSYANPQKILEDLGAKCIHDQTTLCVLPASVLGYPQQIAFLFNNEAEINDLLIHLHGYSFGKLQNGEDFDSTPLTLAKSFKFNQMLTDFPSLMMVIPFTTGKCKDYDTYLRNSKNFETLIHKVLTSLQIKANIHLSAHSGGGRTLARTINRMKTIIRSVSLFDANYSETLSREYHNWAKRSQKILNLIAVAPEEMTGAHQDIQGSTPFNEVRKIYTQFSGIETVNEKVPLDTPRFYFLKKESENTTVTLITEPKQSQHHHWHIVRDSFRLVIQKTLH